MDKELVKLEHLQHYTNKYRIREFTALGGSVCLKDWLGSDWWVEQYGYPTVIMDAILKETTEHAERVRRAQHEKEQQFKLDSMNVGSNLNFGRANESMHRAFN